MAPVWNKIFVKQIIDNYQINFDIKVHYGEDWLFVIDYMRHVQNAIITIKTTYTYRRFIGDTLSTIFRRDGFKTSIYVRHIIAKWFPEQYGTPQIFNDSIIRIAEIYLKSGARSLGIFQFLKWSNEIFYDNDIVKSAQRVNKGILIKSIASRNLKLYKICITFKYLPEYSKYYIKPIIKKILRILYESNKKTVG